MRTTKSFHLAFTPLIDLN